MTRTARSLRLTLAIAFIVGSSACVDEQSQPAPPEEVVATQSPAAPGTASMEPQAARCRLFVRAFGRLTEQITNNPRPPAPLAPEVDAAFASFDEEVAVLATDSPGPAGPAMGTAASAARRLRMEYPQNVGKNIPALRSSVDAVQVACGLA